MKFDLKQCKVCERHFTKICVHHINGNHEDNRKENRIQICEDCHTAIHSGISIKNGGRSRRYKREYENMDRKILIKLNDLRNIWLKSKYGKDTRNNKIDLTTKGVELYPIKF